MNTRRCVGSDQDLDSFTEEAFRELRTYRRQAWLDTAGIAVCLVVSYGLVLFILWAL